MLSVIIATYDSDRPLVATLAALVPGATAGLVREVIVADGRSYDETEQVADYAGCVFFASGEPLAWRLNTAASRARGEWLLFLRPGAVPAATWVDESIAFARRGHAQAAVFSEEAGRFPAWIRRAFALPGPQQGLLIPKPFYAELGGHRMGPSDPESDLLRRIGRPRLTVLRTTVSRSNI